MTRSLVVAHHTSEHERKSHPEPECYDQGFIAAEITGPAGYLYVVSEGERRLNVADVVTISSPTEFRSYFTKNGHNTRDEDQWEYNAWWTIYWVDTENAVADSDGFEPCYDLLEAIECAESAARGDDAEFEKWLKDYVDANADELYEKFQWDKENGLL